jgi:hypothetical protein
MNMLSQRSERVKQLNTYYLYKKVIITSLYPSDEDKHELD